MTDESNTPSEPSEPSEPLEPNEPSEPSEPLEWTLRVSVDGAQRLLHAWKDGRLEKTLGFPIESLQIHTPFTPTGGGGSGPPEDDSRPITLLPWDGISVAGVVLPASLDGRLGPKGGGGGSGGGSAARVEAPAPTPAIEDVRPAAAPPQERKGSGAKKKVAVAVALVAAVLIALWLARSSPDEPTPETLPPEAIEPSAADGGPSSAAADDSRASAAGAEGSAAVEESPAASTTASTTATTAEGTDLTDDTMPDAAAPQTTEPAPLVPQAPAAPPDDATLPRSGDGEAPPGPAEGVASDGKAGPAKPRKGSGGGGKSTSKEDVAPKPPKPPKSKALYSHYRCEPEGGGFSIVVHARNVGEAKAKACGDKGDACTAATNCVPDAS